MIFCADTESQSFSKTYLCGAISWKTSTGNYKTEVFDTKEQQKNWMINKAKQLHKEKHRMVVYMHNSLFDISRIFSLTEKGMKIIKRTTPAIFGYGDNIGTPEEQVYMILIDSMPIFQKSLKETGEMTGFLKTKPNDALELKTHSSENQIYTEEEMKELKAYCANDTICLLKSIESVKDKLKENGISAETIYSAGQIAQKAFNKQVMELDYTIISFHKRNKSDIELVLREGKP